MAIPLIVCVATELEGALLREQLPLLVTGVGAVNAACALTRFLEHERAAVVLNCGIGGAYRDSGLEVGAAVWAASECYGDLGAATADGGFLDMRSLGFPVIAGPEPVYNELRLAVVGPGKPVPFVTVNTCTGSEAAALLLAKRTGGCVESMEGAAIAHVARLYGIRSGEVRGISNPVGNRDRAVWRVREAAEAAQLALLSAWRNGQLS